MAAQTGAEATDVIDYSERTLIGGLKPSFVSCVVNLTSVSMLGNEDVRLPDFSGLGKARLLSPPRPRRIPTVASLDHKLTKWKNPYVTATEDLRFTRGLLTKPFPRGLAVETTLQHFAIVTYWVDQSSLRQLIHSRFEPVCLAVNGRSRRALVSVVTFFDRNFRFAACPYFKRSFGQTNYRAYVQDTQTGEQVAWFFGTCLDSVSVAIPRYLWRLPWYRARMEFDCRYDQAAARYSAYNVRTHSDWAPARLAVEDSGKPPVELAGVSNLEAGLVLLTHPMRGYFFRRDGALGSYTVWHDRTLPTVGIIQEASYPLLQRLALVDEGDQNDIHSVLLQRYIDFTIYLPPYRVKTECPAA